MSKLKEILRPLYVPVTNAYYKKFKAPKRYHHLFDEIKKNRATTILEVGTWNGNRAVEMIRVAQETSPNSKIKYIGFDLFEGLTEEMYHHELSKRPPSIEQVRVKLEKLGAEVYLIKGDTHKTLPEFVKETTEKIDFVFIDGGHNVETVQNDWNSVSKIMYKDTVVIFDDYWRNRSDQSAKPVVDVIDTSVYRVEILPEIDKFNNPDFGWLEISFARLTLK